MSEETTNIVNSYYNDGYVYCILTGMYVKSHNLMVPPPLVKIGKVEMKKNETEQQVVNKLVRRYNTYYPDYEIIQFLRTGDCHKAEEYIFELLKPLHYKREIYVYSYEHIIEAFEKASIKYPNIQDLLEKEDIKNVINANRIIRDMENTKN